MDWGKVLYAESGFLKLLCAPLSCTPMFLLVGEYKLHPLHFYMGVLAALPVPWVLEPVAQEVLLSGLRAAATSSSLSSGVGSLASVLLYDCRYDGCFCVRN